MGSPAKEAGRLAAASRTIAATTEGDQGNKMGVVEREREDQAAREGRSAAGESEREVEVAGESE